MPRDKPDECYAAKCPLAINCRCGHAHESVSPCATPLKAGGLCPCVKFQSISKGFVLGCGDPNTSHYAAILEAPGKDEIAFELKPNATRSFFTTQVEVDREIAIRKRDYPTLPAKFLANGVPVVGQTGAALEFWIWPKVGMRRGEYYIDNTIRCLYPKGKNGAAYPTGEDKKAAEKHCRMWDRIPQYKPDTLVFSLHPAGILREITPLPLSIKDFEKVRDFTKIGRRVAVLLGGKAVKAFATYGENVTKWRGDYILLDPKWPVSYKQQFEYKEKGKGKWQGKAKGTGKRKGQEDKADSMALQVVDILDMGFPLPAKPKFRRKRKTKE